MPKMFTQMQLQAIADALGETSEGLTGSEILHLLQTAKIIDVDPTATKRHRLYNAFVTCQNTMHDRRHILAFVRNAMKPEQYARCPERYEPMRANLNGALAFAGLAIRDTGKLVATEQARTLTEAQRRASELRTDLELRKVHPDVLRFCKEELVKDNYFHAVLEATKSVADKLRYKTGLTEDGAALVDRALAGESPLIAINPLSNDTDRSEQRGFVSLVKGIFGMFRNPTAHAPKIKWAVNKDDVEDVLTLLSMVHKRIDASRMLSRV
jgi:uncharacterized protein (TIGR02391 family)